MFYIEDVQLVPDFSGQTFLDSDKLHAVLQEKTEEDEAAGQEKAPATATAATNEEEIMVQEHMRAPVSGANTAAASSDEIEASSDAQRRAEEIRIMLKVATPSSKMVGRAAAKNWV